MRYEDVISLKGSFRPMTLQEKRDLGGITRGLKTWVYVYDTMRLWLTESEVQECIQVLSQRVKAKDGDHDLY